MFYIIIWNIKIIKISAFTYLLRGLLCMTIDFQKINFHMDLILQMPILRIFCVSIFVCITKFEWVHKDFFCGYQPSITYLMCSWRRKLPKIYWSFTSQSVYCIMSLFSMQIVIKRLLYHYNTLIKESDKKLLIYVCKQL